MTDEQKKVAEEIVTATTAAPTTTADQPAPAATGPVMEELPDEIKKKLEKNKANRLAATKSKRRRRKTERTLTVGSAYIKSTYNNTIVTITDENGDVVSWLVPV